MVWRPLSLGLLVLLAVAPSAGAAGPSAPFPTLKASAGTAARAQSTERRVRRIETSLLGPGHAAEHAQERAAARELARRAPATNTPLKANNALVKPDVGGVWLPGVKLPIVAINSTLMHNGKVLIWAYPWRPHEPDPSNPDYDTDPERAEAYVFDPVTRTTHRVDPPIDPATGKPTNIFCSGTSLLPDGRVLVVGGNLGDPTVQPNQGLNTVFAFDPDSETWTRFAPIRQGRWYPTQTLMPDGRTLVLAGAPKDGDPDWNYKINQDIELISPDGTVQTLQNLRADRDDLGNGSGAPLPGQYPHVWWMPSGHALVAGPRMTDTWDFFEPTAGADDANWIDTPNLPTYREWAAGVLLPGATAADSTRVMLFGGAPKDDHYPGPVNPGDPTDFLSVDTTTTYDDANPAAGWTAGPAMHAKRAFANSVLLPDGKVAVIGGGKGEFIGQKNYRWRYTAADRRVDLYDPDTNTFTAGNAQAEGRTYHSTAILLPDATVMSAGDDINGPTGPGSGVRTDTAEIWRPPYLYNADGSSADRPEITGAPATIEYGKPFAITTTGDADRAVLVAPGADTHNTDMAQRIVPLDTPVTVDGGGADLVAPANANQAPPSYYMLFVVNAHGVPSKARFVKLVPPAAAPEPKLGATVTAKALPLARLRAPGSTLPVRVQVTGGAASVQVTASVGGEELTYPEQVQLTRARTARVVLTPSLPGRRRIATGRRAVVRLEVAATPVGPGTAATGHKRLVLR